MKTIHSDKREKMILDEIKSVGHISTTNDAFAKKLFSLYGDTSDVNPSVKLFDCRCPLRNFNRNSLLNQALSA